MNVKRRHTRYHRLHALVDITAGSVVASMSMKGSASSELLWPSWSRNVTFLAGEVLEVFFVDFGVCG